MSAVFEIKTTGQLLPPHCLPWVWQPNCGSRMAAGVAIISGRNA